jgi:CRISPR-associated protein Csb1
MNQFNALNNAKRLLITAELKPVMGDRIQPTGFKDLNAAEYKLHNGTPMLLVESAQSVANRLEQTVWDLARQSIIEPLQGISYVEVKQVDRVQTASLLESHRINSPYILKATQPSGETFSKQLQAEFSGKATDLAEMAKVIAKYDVNSLLHGVFFAQGEMEGGRIRVARALSGFIEAKNVAIASSGGVKLDRLNPKGDTSKGEGNVPYYRDEYVAESITAYFNLDLQQIRSYRLGDAAEDLLVAIAIWKIQEFLELGLRLRTACDLEYKTIEVKQPSGFQLPEHKALTEQLPTLVAAASTLFADPAVTVLQAAPASSRSRESAGKAGDEAA